jgi:hypothetical protein
MNDYPYNRIVLDIVELLQDLNEQGMVSMFTLNATGNIDVTLFADKSVFDAWLDDNKEFEPLVSRWIMKDDTNAAHMCWNDLIKYRKQDEVAI